MERKVGTVVRGIRGPIINPGDDIAALAANAVLDAARSEHFELRDRDVIAVTESVVARAQGNYVTVQDIADDIRTKTDSDTIGIVFPILSRNRFAICLRGFALAAKKIVIQLSYPSDEVGNHLISYDLLDEQQINPWTDVLTEDRFHELFGNPIHPFTGMDYVQYYREVVEAAGAECAFIFANDPRAILAYTQTVITCDIHTRERSKRQLKAAGAACVLGMDDLLNSPSDRHGYNEAYGLLGSNKATEDKIKLFPRSCQPVVDRIRCILSEATGRSVEVMIYGDGAFKDPVGKIWELADPVVSPAYTAGLEGTPNELKLKYLADNDFAGLSPDEQAKAIESYILKKDADLTGQMAAQGTTPRRLTDLLGSLCDLTSGSGDKGTPFVLIQGYFDNYAN